MKNDITYLGKIIKVDSNAIEVEISADIPSSSPVIKGKVYKLGQIGTFVKITAGNIATYGLVESVSNTPSNINEPTLLLSFGSRYLTIRLIGEKIGNRKFEKGIGLYPTINDEVHIVTDEDLFDLYGKNEGTTAGLLAIGKHASSDYLDVYLDIHKLVLRHTAILGSTGSGKSNSVVAVLKQISGQMHNSRMLLIDPHGEYASAFPNAKVFRIGDTTTPLYIPFWLMNFDELMYFLVGAKSTDDQKPEYRRFRELITQEKKANYHLKAGDINHNYITADSPIPFNIRKIWYKINREINATYSMADMSKQTSETECLEQEGDLEKLKPAEFQPYSMSNGSPYKSKKQEMYSYEKKLLARLKDSRYDFMFYPGDYKDEESSKDLHDLLFDWIGGSERISILDLSNIPFEVMDITVGLITRFVYDSMFWGRNEPNTGRNRPLLIAYEEAHSYLGKSDTIYARSAVEKIFKEGRKFGVGAVVISQRPSELSETILAQVGTFIALRLTNSSDQSIVKSMAPDNMNSLINLLPSLRIGEAVIVGEAINIPSRVRLPLQSPRPDSSDPELVTAWAKEYDSANNGYEAVVKKVREQHF
ncbi:MAG: helicase HerA-like domain-containing protein [Anaerotignum propionicum]|uniref:ATP-binding protein n=1 Tax=Anaerotignum propionicum TaxID=28446 RepID=UPI002B21B28B|nr:helicase HerA-like domain-containing protein [Anaerotignum propionicum]MEA5056119.1 helicase HerA-like domain-containing protein [Anaerotignum propionicum]